MPNLAVQKSKVAVWALTTDELMTAGPQLCFPQPLPWKLSRMTKTPSLVAEIEFEMNMK